MESETKLDQTMVLHPNPPLKNVQSCRVTSDLKSSWPDETAPEVQTRRDCSASSSASFSKLNRYRN